jgi:RecA/RadA recombinase
MAPKKKGDSEDTGKKTKKGKAQVDTSISRSDRAAALMERVNKQMKGHAQIKSASEYELPFMTKRLPTGLLQLDLELRGGFPAGGISQIVGPKNTGKTYLISQVIRQQQFFKGDDLMVLLAMTEMRADRTQARLAGVQISLGNDDIKELERARTEQGLPKFTKEEVAALRKEVGQIHEVHGESAEVLFDVVLDAVHNNAYHLIIIDSFGSIMSAAEAENESLSDKTYGGAAKPITEFLRKLCSMLTMDDGTGHARDVCLIGINQVRDVIGEGGGGKDYKSPGGRALEHAKFVDLLVTSGRQIGLEEPVFTGDGTKKRWVQTGKEVNWKIEKGKAGIHEGGKGSYNFDFRTGTGDFYLDTVVAGVRYGVIEAAGAWYGIPNPENEGEYLLRTNGKDAFIQALADDVTAKMAVDDPNTFMNYIRIQALQKQGIFINFDWK